MVGVMSDAGASMTVFSSSSVVVGTSDSVGASGGNINLYPGFSKTIANLSSHHLR